MKARGILSVILILSLSILLLNDANTSVYVFAGDSYGIIENKNPGVFYGEQLKDSGIAYSYELYNMFKDIDTESEILEYKFSQPIEVEGQNISEVTAQNVEVLKMVNNAVQVALDAFIKDYPEIFWIDFSKSVFSQIFSYSYDSEGNAQWYITKIKVTFSFDESFTETPYDICKTVYGKAYEIIEDADSRSIYYRLKDYHDYLCKNITYTTETSFIRNIYGGLIDGYGVCEAYAESFKFLCDLSGISCVSVMGKAGIPEPDENHLWNYCLMDDGKWYAVDVTWDDQPNSRPPVIYDHFLCGSDNIGSKTNVSFVQSHLPIGDFSLTEIYSFTYPIISTDMYKFDPSRTPTPEPTATATPEPTATPTPEPTATPTPEPTATQTPEPTATQTPEPTVTQTPEPTATPTPEPTATPTPEPTVTPIPVYTDTPLVSIIPSETINLLYFLGDVNEDKIINAEDALMVLKHAAKIEILIRQESLLSADVNKNCTIDAVDALDILKKAASLIEEF